jgi:hypothetical protein
MHRNKFYKFILVVGILVLLVAACGPAADGGDGEEPTGEEQTSPPDPTDVPAAEPTEEPAAEATEEPAADATEEPAADATEAPAETGIEGTMARTATCYWEPKDTSAGIGLVEEGSTVTILGRGVGAGWVAIASPSDPEIGCWLYETDVLYSGEFTDLEIYGRSDRSSDEPVVLPDGFETAVVADVVCLFGPGSGYSTVAALLTGETVIVWGKGIGSGWYVVALIENGDICWLPEDKVDFTDDVNNLTILNAPPKQ